MTNPCRAPGPFDLMHQLCSDEPYKELLMGRRLADSRWVAVVQLVSAGRTPRPWYGYLFELRLQNLYLLLVKHLVQLCQLDLNLLDFGT